MQQEDKWPRNYTFMVVFNELNRKKTKQQHFKETLASPGGHLCCRYTVSFLDNWPDCLMRRSIMVDVWRRSSLSALALPANGGYPSPRLVDVCFFPRLSRSLFSFRLSVGLTRLIIQMSAARSLLQSESLGMFSKVAFLFVMWNQSPWNAAEISSVNSPRCCSAN